MSFRMRALALSAVLVTLLGIQPGRAQEVGLAQLLAGKAAPLSIVYKEWDLQ